MPRIPMANARRWLDAQLRLEQLESREVPATSPWMVETFDQTAPGLLPDGWSVNNSDPNAALTGAPVQTLGAATALRSNGTSNSETRAWSNIAVPADAQVSVNVFLDSLVPAQVFARGRNLDTDNPTYYSASATRG